MLSLRTSGLEEFQGQQPDFKTSPQKNSRFLKACGFWGHTDADRSSRLFSRNPLRRLGMPRARAVASWMENRARYKMRRMRAVPLIALLGMGVAITPIAATGGWVVMSGNVHVVCPLTVGGSFEAKTTSLTGMVAPSASGSPSSGQLLVDLRTLDSGIDLRNDHLRNKYLETEKGEGFNTAVLSDIDLGKVDPQTFQGRTMFTATLLLHGTKKPIAGLVEIKRGRSSVRVNASFPVTLADYGIAKPQYLGIGVKDQVLVEVVFDAAPVAAAGS